MGRWSCSGPAGRPSRCGLATRQEPPCAASTSTPIVSASAPAEEHDDHGGHAARPGRARCDGLEDPGAGLAAAPGHPPVDHDGRIAPPPVVAASRGSGTSTRSSPPPARSSTRPPIDAARSVTSVRAPAGSSTIAGVLGRLDGGPAGVVAVLDHLLDRVGHVAGRDLGQRLAVARHRRRSARRSRAPRARPSSRGAATTRSGVSAEVRRQRLVEDPEDRALHVHRQPPVAGPASRTPPGPWPAGRGRAPCAGAWARRPGRRAPSGGRRR